MVKIKTFYITIYTTGMPADVIGSRSSHCFIDKGEFVRLTCKRIMITLCLLNASVNVLEISHCSVNFVKKT